MSPDFKYSLLIQGLIVITAQRLQLCFLMDSRKKTSNPEQLSTSPINCTDGRKADV
jgi:hypothetical protein